MTELTISAVIRISFVLMVFNFFFNIVCVSILRCLETFKCLIKKKTISVDSDVQRFINGVIVRVFDTH